MRRESFRDKALIVAMHDFGEADRVIVALTRTRGIIRAVAKGVRRGSSRFGSRLQPFVLLDAQFYPGKNLATLTGADTVEYLAAGIIDDYGRYTAACAVLDTAHRLAEDGLPDSELFDAAVGALRTMRTSTQPTVELDGFVLQALGLAGLAPSLFDCAGCQKPGPHRAFVAALGGAVCSTCRPPGTRSIDPQVLRLMWLVSHGHQQAAQQLLSAPGSAALAGTMHTLVRSHISYHLGRSVGALALVED